MRDIHLICNAHIDPVWQWEWDEGLAETLSTFRIAADFCEQFDGFVFNHNESLLYEWVEEYDPPLFARIRRLAADGRWHIMGGWYIQPDCLMPSGESLLRQIETGRRYFEEKFGCRPTTAVNVDSFGHDRGLVQLLRLSGYDSYLIGRPQAAVCGLESRDFRWTGHDGSAVTVHLADSGYSSLMGRAAEKIACLMDQQPEASPLMILWGIGNHGGGPSRIDLERIALLQAERTNTAKLRHSTPEAYFGALDSGGLPTFDADLAPVMVGCYTSQVRVKQTHRQLENLLLQTEKMAVAAETQTGVAIDWAGIRQAEKTLLFHQFHDILPGTSIQRAEEAALQAMGGGMELLRKQRMRAFMALAGRFGPSPAGTIPVLVYHPHPWPDSRAVACEFMLPDQNWTDSWTDYEVYHNGRRIPSQVVKEDSNIALDWRKRIVCRVELEPFAMTRLECRPIQRPDRPILPAPDGAPITLTGRGARAAIDPATGLIAAYTVGGEAFLREQAGRLLVLEDNEDPWGMTTDRYDKVCGAFALATPDQAAALAGLSEPLPPVRVIEQGDVLTTVEAVMAYHDCRAVVRYTMNRDDDRLEVDLRLLWLEPNRMVKWELPCRQADAVGLGQGVCGTRTLYDDGRENVAQKWLAVRGGEQALTVLNTGTYGSDYCRGVLRQTLLHTPAYAGHPIGDRPILPRDRCLPRIDMGERLFRFVLQTGPSAERMERVGREALVENEPPVALSAFTSGEGAPPPPFLTLSNPAVILTAMIKTPDGPALRVFNSTDRPQKAAITCRNGQADLLLEGYQMQCVPMPGAANNTDKAVRNDEVL